MVRSSDMNTTRSQRPEISVEKSARSNNTERERIRNALKLAEARWRDFDRRRAYEWKVNFALWAALGSFSGFLWKIDNVIDKRYAITVIILLIAFGLLYWFRWTVGLWRRNKYDQDAAYYYWRRADGDKSALDPWSEKPPIAFEWEGSLKDGHARVYALVTWISDHFYPIADFVRDIRGDSLYKVIGKQSRTSASLQTEHHLSGLPRRPVDSAVQGMPASGRAQPCRSSVRRRNVRARLA
jgi:hypothetical protein